MITLASGYFGCNVYVVGVMWFNLNRIGCRVTTRIMFGVFLPKALKEQQIKRWFVIHAEWSQAEVSTHSRGDNVGIKCVQKSYTFFTLKNG